MESLVSGIKQLNGVLIVVMPDCLLYSAWQRPGQTWDTEVVGAFFGELIRAHLDGLDAIQGWSNVTQVTLELDEALIIVRTIPDKEHFIAGFVFDKAAAIGWARLQVQRVLGAIDQSLDAAAGGVSAPEGVSVPEASAPIQVPDPVKAPPPTPAVSPPPPAVEAAKPAVVKPPAARSEPTPEPATRPPARTAAPSGESERARGEQLPKGTRLIKYLDAHAPDTHAALLRVSLQTGLPLTLLRMPDSLSDDEFAQVEESVRRILGVEQLNF